MVANVTQVCQLENMAYSDFIHRMCEKNCGVKQITLRVRISY
jgi:hypothetical protein